MYDLILPNCHVTDSSQDICVMQDSVSISWYNRYINDIVHIWKCHCIHIPRKCWNFIKLLWFFWCSIKQKSLIRTLLLCHQWWIWRRPALFVSQTVSHWVCPVLQPSCWKYTSSILCHQLWLIIITLKTQV